MRKSIMTRDEQVVFWMRKQKASKQYRDFQRESGFVLNKSGSCGNMAPKKF
jgi:hypothetical protein